MYSDNFDLRLMQGPHVRCVVSELNIDATDIVYLGVTVDALFSDISSNSAGLHFLLRLYM